MKSSFFILRRCIVILHQGPIQNDLECVVLKMENREVEGSVLPLKSLQEELINLLPQFSHLFLIGFTILRSRFHILLKRSQSLVHTRLHIRHNSESLHSRGRRSMNFHLLMKRLHMVFLLPKGQYFLLMVESLLFSCLAFPFLAIPFLERIICG